MSERKIRPEVVSLLADLTPDGHPQTWRHDDGQPVTPAELNIVLGATRTELLAAREYVHRIADLAAEKVAATNRIHEITEPYLHRVPVPSPLEMMLLVTDAERVELARLLDLVAPEGRLAER